MVEWIRCVKEIKTNRENHKMNDIRKLVITKRKSRKKGKDKEEIEEVESENEYDSDNSYFLQISISHGNQCKVCSNSTV